MMRYPLIHIILLAVSIVFLLLGIVASFWFIVMAFWLAISLTILVWGSSSICSGMYLNVLCSANTKKKQISITFDDGPHPELTPAIMDILKQHDIKAVFFIKGRDAAENTDILKRMDEEGHIIANHSWSHSHWFDFFPFLRVKQELDNTNLVINNITGKTPLLFRPPYGVTNPPLGKAVKMLKMITIGWSIRSMDTLKRDPGKIVDRIKQRIAPGKIVLLHDNQPQAEEILGRIIDAIKEKGYKIVPLDQLLNIKAYGNN